VSVAVGKNHLRQANVSALDSTLEGVRANAVAFKVGMNEGT